MSDISVLKSKLWSQRSSDFVVGDITTQEFSTPFVTDGSLRV